MAQVELLTRGGDPVVDVDRLLGRDIELVTQLTDIRDPDAQDLSETDVYVSGGAERKGLVR